MPANRGQGNTHSRTSPLPQEHRKTVGGALAANRGRGDITATQSWSTPTLRVRWRHD
jgi:hypothetical protein